MGTDEKKTAGGEIILDSGRRKFLSTTALVGLAGAGLSVGLSSCKEGEKAIAPATVGKVGSEAPNNAAANVRYGEFEVAPGQLDDYYEFSSGGHSGEVRVYALPSGRTLKRIPVFNIDCESGWGITNESKAIMGTNPDGSLKYKTGDTHHVHGSYADGTYDGKYLYTNDKIHGRIARIRLDYMVCDKITEIPNVQGTHGIFPDKRDPVDPKINYTTRVFLGQEFHIPQPNDGRDENDPAKYYCIFTCVDAETMQPRWQCKVDGNMDLVATSYDGKLAASNQYNTENGVTYEEMMSAEMDACVFFNIARIEAAVKAGKTFTIGTSKVPVVDGTKKVNQDPKTSLTCYVPVPKNPHGVNATPDGKYFSIPRALPPVVAGDSNSQPTAANSDQPVAVAPAEAVPTGGAAAGAAAIARIRAISIFGLEAAVLLLSLALLLTAFLRPRGPAQIWRRALRLSSLVGVSKRPAETPLEFGRRASIEWRQGGPAMLRLAEAVTTISYAPPGLQMGARQQVAASWPEVRRHALAELMGRLRKLLGRN